MTSYIYFFNIDPDSLFIRDFMEDRREDGGWPWSDPRSNPMEDILKVWRDAAHMSSYDIKPYFETPLPDRTINIEFETKYLNPKMIDILKGNT